MEGDTTRSAVKRHGYDLISLPGLAARASDGSLAELRDLEILARLHIIIPQTGS